MELCQPCWSSAILCVSRGVQYVLSIMHKCIMVKVGGKSKEQK